MPAELCLGTVQFGMDYGIAGQKKPSLTDSVTCLDYAVQHGIHAIDTAEAYGTAQEVVGTFLQKNTVPRETLCISTKLCPNILDDISPDRYEETIAENLEHTLKILHTDYVDKYYFHSARYAFQAEMLEALHRMAEKGLAKAVGVSVYEPEEAEACLNSSLVGCMQFPYSIFDHRMKEAGIFQRGEKSDCEIDVRSAFIQGLILLEAAEVPEFLAEARPIVAKLKSIAEETGISRAALCMAYIKREKAVAHLVFGVDSLRQIKEDIELFNSDIDKDILSLLDREFAGLKAEIVMPSLWKR